MNCVGIDIGGANIKFANAAGRVHSVAFPLWKRPRELSQVLRETLQARFAGADTLLAVMTGELADCYETREHGVREIAQALQQAANGRRPAWFGLDQRWHGTGDLHDRPALFAASNWLALARAVAQALDEPDALLLDIGSSTTDIVPIRQGVPTPSGVTDTQRLLHRELVYLGVQRTPLCAVIREAPYRDAVVPVASEWFSTTLDAFLILCRLAEGTGEEHTADGRPATREAARQRLARTVLAIGEDEFSARDATRLAEHVERQIVERITTALEHVARSREIPLAHIVVGGGGAFVAEQVLGRLGIERPLATTSQLLGAATHNCDTALALVRLWQSGSPEKPPDEHK